MKKLVSLLLAVMLVMSMMTFNVMASTDTEIAPNTLEENLALDNLTSTRTSGFYTNKSGGVVIAKERATSNNNIFKLKADYTGSATGSYLLAGYHSGIQNSQLTRYSAKISLPSVEGDTAITGVFVPERTYTVSPKPYTDAGIFLKNGGAYCYDRTLGAEQAFVPAGTMQANKWYRVEAIYDTRAMTADATTSKVYMNAFVFDGETNGLVGTSGWRFVAVDTGYSGQKSYRMPIIQAYKYTEGSYVLIDDYKIYKISNAPAYEYELKAEISQKTPTNKYIAMEPTNATGTFRSLGEYFNSGYPVIKEESENKATRIEMDFRIPTLSNTNVYNLLTFYKSKPYAGSGNNPFEGTAYIDSAGFKVRSYDYTAGKYANAVNLMAPDSTYTLAAYTIEENTWYKLVWDCDFTNYSAPTATLKLLDENGNLLTQTQSYAAGPMPVISSDNARSSILYCGSYLNSGEIHIDNTNAYYATTVANLDSADTRNVRYEEDFEIYTEEDSENYSAYAVGNTYEDNITILHGISANLSKCTHAYVRMEELSQEEGDSDVTVLNSTSPVSVDFTYSNPVPASVLTTNNIEFYADGIKMSTGYTITPGTLDANNCTTTFTVATGVLDWGTDYVVRVKAEVVDYNAALSGGVPAEPGLYKDIAFSVADLTPDCTIAGEFVEGAGTVGAKVTFNSNEDSPLTCYAILAVYEGNKLVGLKKSAEITVPANAENYEAAVEATALPAGAKAKIFVWNNFETMRPWVSPIVLGE